MSRARHVHGTGRLMYADPELVERFSKRVDAAFRPLLEAAVKAPLHSEPTLKDIHAARRECTEIVRNALLEAERKGAA